MPASAIAGGHHHQAVAVQDPVGDGGDRVGALAHHQGAGPDHRRPRQRRDHAGADQQDPPGQAGARGGAAAASGRRSAPGRCRDGRCARSRRAPAGGSPGAARGMNQPPTAQPGDQERPSAPERAQAAVGLAAPHQEQDEQHQAHQAEEPGRRPPTGRRLRPRPTTRRRRTRPGRTSRRASWGWRWPGPPRPARRSRRSGRGTPAPRCAGPGSSRVCGARAHGGTGGAGGAGRDSGGYHFPSEASHHPSPCGRSLMHHAFPGRRQPTPPLPPAAAAPPPGPRRRRAGSPRPRRPAAAARAPIPPAARSERTPLAVAGQRFDAPGEAAGGPPPRSRAGRPGRWSATSTPPGRAGHPAPSRPGRRRRSRRRKGVEQHRGRHQAGAARGERQGGGLPLHQQGPGPEPAAGLGRASPARRPPPPPGTRRRRRGPGRPRCRSRRRAPAIPGRGGAISRAARRTPASRRPSSGS